MDENIADKFWGKTNPYYSAYHHMLDTAAVAAVFWEKRMKCPDKAIINQAFGLDEKQSHSLFLLLTAAHDIGKISYNFTVKTYPNERGLMETNGNFENRQKIHELNKQYLEKEGFELLTKKHDEKDLYHGTLSVKILSRIFEKMGAEKTISLKMAHISGIHHGRYIRSEEMGESDYRSFYNKDQRNKQKQLWEQSQDIVFNKLAKDMNLVEIDYKNIKCENECSCIYIAGAISIFDWISSGNMTGA